MTGEITNFDLDTNALESYSNEVLKTATDDDDYSLTVTLFADPAFHNWMSEWFSEGRPEENGDYELYRKYTDYTMAMRC